MTASPKRLFAISLEEIGDRPKFAWQTGHGTHIAAVGSLNVITIRNRQGDEIASIPLKGSCLQLSWDKDGDTLAAITEKSNLVYLWSANSQKTNVIDTQAKDSTTVISWSKSSPILAIGTSRGNIILYDQSTAKKLPLIGQHSGRITTMAWSKDNLLAIGANDNRISVMSSTGTVLQRCDTTDTPKNLKFSEMKREKRGTYEESTVSAIIGKKHLGLWTVGDPNNAAASATGSQLFTLNFQDKYGDINDYQWFGDGYIMIGFSGGYFIVISTYHKEIGEELHKTRDHKGYLSSIAISTALNKSATCGNGGIKIHELSDQYVIDTIITIDEGNDNLSDIAWSVDGQLLAVSKSSGAIYVYLTKLSMLASVWQQKIAFMTSLCEVSIYDHQTKTKIDNVHLTTEIEPSVLAMSDLYIAVGFNNHALYYRIQSFEEVIKVSEHDYLSTISELQINSHYAAAFMSGRIQLHMIEESEHHSEERHSIMFPLPDTNDGKIVCYSLTKDFLIYGTDKGTLIFFHIDEWQIVNKFDKHKTSIQKLFTENFGTSVAFIDQKGDGYLYNVFFDHPNIIQIPNIPSGTRSILWETSLENEWIFISFDSDSITTHSVYRDSLKGPQIMFVGTTRLPIFGSVPLLLNAGLLLLLDSSGKIVQTKLETYGFLNDSGEQEYTLDDAIDRLSKAILMKRYDDAMFWAKQLNDSHEWNKFATALLYSLNIDYAIKVFREIGHSGMVMALEEIKHVEDKNLVSAHFAALFGDYDLAQELFLKCGCPLEALNMRRDCMQFEAAMTLAKAYDPDQIPYISSAHAEQLEFTGDSSSAVKFYEQGITKKEKDLQHDQRCFIGLARCYIKVGDIKKGTTIALRLPGKEIKEECAKLLEGLKQWPEAAELFEKAECWDNAAIAYIKMKNWVKVSEILPNVNTPKIHSMYAKARENEGRFKEACAAYMRAGEWENAIRIQLNQLKSPEQAVKIVRETHSIEGAKMVARFFESINDYSAALQFLVLSKCYNEAFIMAQQNGLMELYAQVIEKVLKDGRDIPLDDLEGAAIFFQNQNNHLFAGKFFMFAQNYDRALTHLMRCTGANESKGIDLAITCVGKARSQQLTQKLLEYLLGEKDQIPKEAKYLFRFYLSLGQYIEASKTAIIIAQQDQESGNYRSARDVLFTMHQELKAQRTAIPFEMANSLMLLHSYILVKIQIKLSNHNRAARLLNRVSHNVSKFPAHIVQILTTTVIECQKAGMNNSAFNFALILMRHEYREQIDPKYKKKIEALVRKPDKSESDEDFSQCPHCHQRVPDYELLCPSCQLALPYCIVTGAHIIREDLCLCPSCNFPAIYSEFLKYLSIDDTCPMCTTKIDGSRIMKLDSGAAVDSFLAQSSDMS
ncbi:unnamed protein product [Rotaria sp. Silwood1]|nr:unnamed protein product [Rotaria sp. Silwood1]CAF3439616.1 unnamed protein product [Rotaria sp. Silwood1]CAF4484482.1 unnamed protein product [Rotaria sp. Silwood1]